MGVTHSRSDQQVATRLHLEAKFLFDKSLYPTTDTFDYALENSVELASALGLHQRIPSFMP